MELRICQGCEALVDEFAQNAQGLILCRSCSLDFATFVESKEEHVLNDGGNVLEMSSPSPHSLIRSKGWRIGGQSPSRAVNVRSWGYSNRGSVRGGCYAAHPSIVRLFWITVSILVIVCFLICWPVPVENFPCIYIYLLFAQYLACPSLIVSDDLYPCKIYDPRFFYLCAVDTEDVFLTNVPQLGYTLKVGLDTSPFYDPEHILVCSFVDLPS